MGPNDIDLVRVFTRAPSATIGNTTFPITANIEVVVEAEAGATIFGTGAAYSTNIVVRDVTANNNIAATPAGGFAGAMAAPPVPPTNWSAVEHQFVYTIPAASLAGRANHVCEVVAFLSAGVLNPDVEFVTSPMFLLTP